MGVYDPYQPYHGDAQTLENEKQAAAWMDCVWSADCSDLDPSVGLCSPIQ